MHSQMYEKEESEKVNIIIIIIVIIAIIIIIIIIIFISRFSVNFQVINPCDNSTVNFAELVVSKITQVFQVIYDYLV